MSFLRLRASHNALPQLGELELALLDVLWRNGNCDAKSAHKILESQRQIGLNTVQSTLDRLYKKKMINRRKSGHAYIYQSQVRRSELMGKIIGGVIQTLHDGPTDTILSSFVSAAASLDEAALDKLQSLIDTHRELHRDDH